jgi:hypothetical protein
MVPKFLYLYIKKRDVDVDEWYLQNGGEPEPAAALQVERGEKSLH